MRRETSLGQYKEARNNEFTFSTDINDYEIGNAIGYGSSAVVHIGKFKPLDKVIAVKLIDLDILGSHHLDELRKEIQIMSLSRHPNLLLIYGSFVHESKLHIFMPFLVAGSCLDIMRTAHPYGLEEPIIGAIIIQGLEGLNYLHNSGLMHRDVKAGNLLIGGNGVVQLADFGVSSSLMEAGERKGLRKTFAGTPCWMAPEVMEQSSYNFKADIWSFGITALELANGHAPFAKYSPMKILMLTIKRDPPTLDRSSTRHKFSRVFKEMIDTCLSKDPTRRPTTEKLLQHPFFKQTVKRNISLVNTLLAGLPPINKRAHNKNVVQNKENKGNDISWDFETPVDGNSSLREELSSEELIQTIERRLSDDQKLQNASPKVKKSRFVIDSSTSQSRSALKLDREESSLNANHQSQKDIAFSTLSTNRTLNVPTPKVDTINSPSVSELRKGRFCVNQFPGKQFIHPQKEQPLDENTTQPGNLYLTNTEFMYLNLVQEDKATSLNTAVPDPALANNELGKMQSKDALPQKKSDSQRNPANSAAANKNSSPLGQSTIGRRGRFEVSKEIDIKPHDLAGGLTLETLQIADLTQQAVATTSAIKDKTQILVQENKELIQLVKILLLSLNKLGKSPEDLGSIVPSDLHQVYSKIIQSMDFSKD